MILILLCHFYDTSQLSFMTLLCHVLCPYFEFNLLPLSCVHAFLFNKIEDSKLREKTRSQMNFHFLMLSLIIRLKYSQIRENLKQVT